MKEPHHTPDLCETSCTLCGAETWIDLSAHPEGLPANGFPLCWRCHRRDLTGVFAAMTALATALSQVGNRDHHPPRNPAQKGNPMKPERIRMGLRSLPGWEHDEKNNALVRIFRLPGTTSATAFLTSLAELGAAKGIHPRIELHGDTVTLVVHGGPDGIQEQTFEQAHQLTL